MLVNKGRIRPKGMALVTALMVLVILGIIAGCFAMVMNRDSRQARISSYQIICLNAAQAGIDYAIMLHKHNLACYPLRDYSQNISPNNMLPMNNAYNSQKQVYPAKGSVYNLPKAGLTSSGGSKYSPVGDRTGEYKNQANTYKEWDTEYLFVNDLSFWTDKNGDYSDVSPDNFMHDSPYIVTFQIRESVEKLSGNKCILHLVSTGKLRCVPEDYNWLTQDNWTGFADTLSQGTGSSGLSSRRLEELGFSEYASRTVAADFSFSSANPANGGYPSIVSSSVVEDLPVNRQYQMPERKKREWFR